MLQERVEELDEARAKRLGVDLREAAANDMALAAADREAGEEEDSTDEPTRDASSPQPPRPQISNQEQYPPKWRRLLRQHTRKVASAFGPSNLVPCPVPELWQDAPHVPFGKLQSDEAQARLSVCRPIFDITPAQVVRGTHRYAHNHGDVYWAKRGPTHSWSISATIPSSALIFLLLKFNSASRISFASTLGSNSKALGSHRCLTQYGVISKIAFSLLNCSFKCSNKQFSIWASVLYISPKGFSKRVTLREFLKFDKRVCVLI